MEYYSALKRKEILMHATTRMDTMNIMLNETSQSLNDRYYMNQFIWGTWSIQIHKDRKQNRPQGWE